MTDVEKVNPAGHVQWLPSTAEHFEVGTTASQSASASHGMRMLDEVSVDEKKVYEERAKAVNFRLTYASQIKSNSN